MMHGRNNIKLYKVLYYYQRSTYFWRFFRPSSGAFKTVLSFFPAVYRWCGWGGTNPSTPAVDSRKA
jgi:hypothetical protein